MAGLPLQPVPISFVISREPGLSGQGVLLHSHIVLLNVPIDLDGLFAVQWRDSDSRVVVVVLAHPPETILLLDRIDTGLSRRGGHHHHKRGHSGVNHGRTMAERCTITRAFTHQSHRIKRMIDQASQPCLWSANPDLCQSRVSPIGRAGRFADTAPAPGHHDLLVGQPLNASPRSLLNKTRQAWSSQKIDINTKSQKRQSSRPNW